MTCSALGPLRRFSGEQLPGSVLRPGWRGGRSGCWTSWIRGSAALLTARTPRAVMWVLRNGFSGAYNRSAYLMWVGGGTGPAV